MPSAACSSVRLTAADVRRAIEIGEVIASYLDDTPYPSYLVLGLIGGIPMHVVVAVNAATSSCTVVNVYKPDDAVWHPDYRTRR